MAEYRRVQQQVQALIEAIPPQERYRYYVVFDIDETILTTRDIQHLLKSSRDIFRLQYRGNFSPIPEMVELYHWIRQSGVNVAFITGRRRAVQEPTMKNLRAVLGDSLERDIVFFKDSGWKSTEDYKIQARKSIADVGYTILANIGDQPTDLSGGYSQHTFLLPSTY